MIKQSIMFLLACVVVACQPVNALDYNDRQELFLIQSCLGVGMVLGDTDVIYYWNNRLVKYAETHTLKVKEYQDTIRYTKDLVNLLPKSDLQDIIMVCKKEAGNKI